MKKIILLVFMTFLSVTLVACRDKKVYDDSLNVIFFTYKNDQAPPLSYFNLEKGSLIEKPEEDPIRVGFTFKGWFEDVSGTIPFVFETFELQTSIIIYAKWEAAIYNIEYEVYGGVLPDNAPTKFTVGESKTLPRPTGKRGYTFVSWYLYEWLDSNGNIATKPGDFGYQSIPSKEPKDIKLFAHWKPLTSNVTFNVNFPVENEGPEKPSSRSVQFDSIISFETFSSFTHEKYSFKGWNTSADGTGVWFNNGETFDHIGALSIYAIWELK
ncbi:InlB B-repeat-containing protein [Haploplasma modicum]|uniref:InlB B-repeat-containing protein n=1 Tax=Haploplasma modicum TaxID=2150 RepID=UPI00047AA354|nr:InlB B-repeat-containing protein [Haploplasma modicum]